MEISIPVQKTVVLEPFNKLVRLVARVLYDNPSTVSNNKQKSARNDTRGITPVVLEALMRQQWVKEEDLAKDLKQNAKQIRKILRYLEEEKLVTRYHRRESSKRAKMYNVAVAATTDGRAEDNTYDIVRCKLGRIKTKLKDELEDKNTVQEYGCPNCKRKYNALDALRLISMEDESFRCENCNGELVVECKKLTSEVVVDGGDNTKRQQREKLKVLLQTAEALMDQMNRVKDLPCPEFECFPAWEARAAKAARENGDLNLNDLSRSQGGYGSTPMPFLGETKVEVNIGEEKQDVKSEDGDSSRKVFPSWLIKKGMNLTEEQRGEMRQEANIDDVSGGAVELSDDKISAMGNGDDKYLKDEYLKAYYAALRKKLEVSEKPTQQESAGVSTPSDRQVGMKSKREEEDEDVEWKEEAPGADLLHNKKM